MQAVGLVLMAYQDSLRKSLDVIANNVANASTTGYKRQEIQFETLVSKTSASDRLSFATDKSAYRDTAQGPLLSTGNPLDLAIQGPGYFQVQTKNGTRYTRGGALQIGNTGELVTPNGNPVLGDGEQPISIPPDAQNIHISGDGVVTAKTGAGSAMTRLGKVKLVKFEEEQGLKALGENLYESEQKGESDDTSRLVQGMVEGSNVQSVREITKMVDILRTYQMSMHLLDLDGQRQVDSIARLAKATA